MSRGKKTNPLGHHQRIAGRPLNNTPHTKNAAGSCPFCAMGEMEVFGEVKDLMIPERSGPVYACNYCEQMLDWKTWERIQEGEKFSVDPVRQKYFQEYGATRSLAKAQEDTK